MTHSSAANTSTPAPSHALLLMGASRTSAGHGPPAALRASVAPATADQISAPTRMTLSPSPHGRRCESLIAIKSRARLDTIRADRVPSAAPLGPGRDRIREPRDEDHRRRQDHRERDQIEQ